MKTTRGGTKEKERKMVGHCEQFQMISRGGVYMGFQLNVASKVKTR